MTKRRILRAQGGYYVATGLWPLLSMRSFERVTGPKVDKWLVQMVGMLAATIGATLLMGASDEAPDNTLTALAMMSAVSFASIDVVHAARRRISPVYLGDALVEASIIALLVISE